MERVLNKNNCVLLYNGETLVVQIPRRRSLVKYVTRKPIYVQRNIEARPCNRCCSGKAISVTYCECVFVALGIQRLPRPFRLLVIVAHYLINGTILEEKFIDYKFCDFWQVTNLTHNSFI